MRVDDYEAIGTKVPISNILISNLDHEVIDYWFPLLLSASVAQRPVGW